MKFKRNEAFRYALDTQVEVSFKILPEDFLSPELLAPVSGVILDISPQGIKMYSDALIIQNLDRSSKIEAKFIIDTQPIHVVGKIIWRKAVGNGNQIGVHFDSDTATKELIIAELKSRRKKEVIDAKRF